jgi:hypothetical protein
VVKKPTKKQVSLCKGLRQLGFTQGNQMKLYGDNLSCSVNQSPWETTWFLWPQSRTSQGG